MSTTKPTVKHNGSHAAPGKTDLVVTPKTFGFEVSLSTAVAAKWEAP